MEQSAQLEPKFAHKDFGNAVAQMCSKNAQFPWESAQFTEQSAQLEPKIAHKGS